MKEATSCRCNLLRIAVLLVLPFTAFGYGAGALTGKINDPSGAPVIGASVLVVGTQSGSMSDANGYYYIPRLSPGEYSVVARMVGMASVTVEGVAVVSDQNTVLNITLAEEAAGNTVITVTGQRSDILETIPSTIYVVDRHQIETMPVTGVIDVIQGQAGVSTQNGEIHIRGGRSGEVEFLLNGSSMRSPVSGRYSATIPLSAIAEASTITGGFGAEYGNALSGVVKMVTREGGEAYTGSFSLNGGDVTAFGTESSEDGPSNGAENGSYLSSIIQGTASIGGPEPFTSLVLPSLGIRIPGKVFFFGAAEYSRSGFNLEDSRGNWENNWQNNLSGVMNITGRPSQLLGFSILGRYSYRQRGWDEWAWSRYDQPVYVEGVPYLGGNPDFALPVSFDESWGLTLGLNGLIGQNTVVEGALERSEFSAWSRIRDECGGYLGANLTPSAWYGEFFEDRVPDSLGFFHSGIHPSVWMDSRSSVTAGRLEMTNQLSSVFKLVSGVEGKLYDIYNYGVTVNSPSQIWVNIWEADPRAVSAFVQSSANFSGAMVLTTGLRADLFDPNTTMVVPGEAGVREVPVKVQISPRFGMNHPISERDVFFVTYGRYFQMPSLDKMFSGTSYNLGGDYTIVGNPDLEAVRTLSYEAGIRHRTGELSNLSLSAFYKEITGLVQSFPLMGEGQGTFFMYENDDSYATVQGVEATFMRLPGDVLSGNISYTYSIAEGRYSSANEQYVYSSAGYSTIPEDDNYLDWDQRHLVSALVSASFEEGEGPEIAGRHFLERAGIGVRWHFGSGYPYSPSSEGVLPEINTARQPWTMSTDLMISRSIPLGDAKMDCRMTVFNLFDRKNLLRIHDPLTYETTGEPGGLSQNPAAWSPARHIYFGVGVGW